MFRNKCLFIIGVAIIILAYLPACGAIPNEDVETTTTDVESDADDAAGADKAEEGESDSGATSGTDDDTESEEPVEDPHDRFLRGQDIFTTNCAVCHGSFETRPPSHVPLYTQARIEWGIANVPGMQELDFLTEEEIITIIYALQVNNGVIAEGDDIVVYDTPVQ